MAPFTSAGILIVYCQRGFFFFFFLTSEGSDRDQLGDWNDAERTHAHTYKNTKAEFMNTHTHFFKCLLIDVWAKNTQTIYTVYMDEHDCTWESRHTHLQRLGDREKRDEKPLEEMEYGSSVISRFPVPPPFGYSFRVWNKM